MHHNTKSELVPCLETLVQPNHDVPDVDVRIVDGAALVHSIDMKKCRTTTIKTFHDYSLQVFMPCIVQLLSDVIRVDIVWDIYKRDSLGVYSDQRRAFFLLRKFCCGYIKTPIHLNGARWQTTFFRGELHATSKTHVFDLNRPLRHRHVKVVVLLDVRCELQTVQLFQ